MSQQFNVVGQPVEEQRIGPTFLGLVHHMDPLVEEEDLAQAVIPAAIGREHVVLLPGEGFVPERSHVVPGIIDQFGGFHEHRIREHVHPFGKGKQLGFGIVGSGLAFDNLPVLVPHGSAVAENCHGVTGVIIQIMRSQRVPVLVLQLNERAAELRQVFINQIIQFVAGKNGLVLDDLYIADGIDDLVVHVPKRRVAKQVGIVVQETRRSNDLSVTDPVNFQQLGALGAQFLYQRILPLRLLGEKARRTRQQAQ